MLGDILYTRRPVDAVVYFKKLINHANADESQCETCGNVNPEQIFNIIDLKVVDEYGELTGDRKIALEWNQHYHDIIKPQEMKIKIRKYLIAFLKFQSDKTTSNIF